MKNVKLFTQEINQVLNFFYGLGICLIPLKRSNHRNDKNRIKNKLRCIFIQLNTITQHKTTNTNTTDDLEDFYESACIKSN